MRALWEELPDQAPGGLHGLCPLTRGPHSHAKVRATCIRQDQLSAAKWGHFLCLYRTFPYGTRSGHTNSRLQGRRMTRFELGVCMRAAPRMLKGPGTLSSSVPA